MLIIGITARVIANRETLVSKLSCPAGLPALRYSAMNETAVKEKKKAITQPSFPLRPVVKSRTTDNANEIKKLSTFCERSRTVGSHGFPGFGIEVDWLIAEVI
jgi:hypothetical protein